MFTWQGTAGPIRAGFSDSDHDVRDPASLSEVLDAFGSADPGAQMAQVHGCDVGVASRPGTTPDVDALVSDQAGLTLVVRVADCVPVLLADAAAGVIGAAHAGRRGVQAQVVPAALDRMSELGASEITAWIGPHVCGRCYEVPREMAEEVSSVVPETASVTRWGTTGLDLGAGVQAQLSERGVRVVDQSRCTMESDDLFSWRRQGEAAGRFAGMIRMDP